MMIRGDPAGAQGESGASPLQYSGGFFMTRRRDELMRIVRELSYEEREVTLASGRKSNLL
jgi:hypothetical protein